LLFCAALCTYNTDTIGDDESTDDDGGDNGGDNGGDDGDDNVIRLREPSKPNRTSCTERAVCHQTFTSRM